MKYHLLLVEDDEIDVMMVQRAINRGGVQMPLSIARDGLEALDLLRGANGRDRIDRPVIVLSDINMPRMNGIEFLAELRKDEAVRTTPVIILTSSQREQDVQDAFDHHVAGYLVKPMHMNELVEMMQVIARYWQSSEMPPDRKVIQD
jgi:CheY-like chemotaxis protein